MGGRPYHKLEIDGRTYKLRLVTAGICEIEQKFGYTFTERETYRISDIVHILYASLFDYHEKEATMKLASRIFDVVKEDRGLDGVGKLFADLLGDYFPDAKKRTESGNTGTPDTEEPEKNPEVEFKSPTALSS